MIRLLGGRCTLALTPAARCAATAAKTTIKVKVTASDGDSSVSDYKIGENLMDAIRDDGSSPADMQGICNGTVQCSTCHVYVAAAWYDKVKALCPLTVAEEDILDEALEVREGESRLSCQVVLQEALDGLEVAMPKTTSDMRWAKALKSGPPSRK